MSLLDIITLVGVIGGPLSGIIVAVVVDRRSKRNKNVDTDVAMRTVQVDEKEAHNHEVAIIIEGFTASLANIRVDLAEARTIITSQGNELKETRKEIGVVRAEMAEAKVERDELVAHIIQLEHLVPNPPGPPTRPIWLRSQPRK